GRAPISYAFQGREPGWEECVRLAQIPARLFWLQINIEAAVKFAEPFSGSSFGFFELLRRRLALAIASTNQRGNPMAIKSGRRELIDTGTDKRYVKRNPDGTFKESVDVGRSLAADRRSKSKKTAKPGYGGQGDQSKRSTKKV